MSAQKRSPGSSAKLTWLSAATRAEELLGREGLPLPKKPSGLLGHDYDFPTDPSALTSMQLGRLKLELASLREWSRVILGKQEIFLHELELVMDYLVPLAMLELVRTDEFKKLPRAALVKEVLRSAAIDADDQLKRLFHRIVELKVLVERIQLQFNVYDGHFYALSREQSRREALARGGIPD